ncbi:Fic family protein [Thomasclavelia cocleata]|uniref:Fic/DOC family protein n=1 Tax=Thomasclavelia cocleata TaxID=69824 RepID=A0A1I0G351_9FIRM|nr:Fic family protein [Thomasclavelia cocleata]MCR1960996.1 Fic family protein [Thomasclavelia cocleata]SET64442.1 Fic/DOC family protein [Thomasclavelia cocleata]
MTDIEKLKKELIEQKESKFPGNIYHVSQVLFAYNSNKIEGSRLTEEQTEMIFETNSFFSDKDDEVVRVDDIMETVNHFKLFDFILDHVDDELNKDMIIEMNKILKKGTSDESNPRYNVGGFKIHPNVIVLVNAIKTSKPDEVEKDIDMLISNYTKQSKITLEDIVEFHLRFERIHPFGDGNGRIGRAIIFKECLKNV